MKGRLLMVAIAATSLWSCSTPPGRQAHLIEKDGRFAIAVAVGKKVEIYPLPRNAYVIVDGKPDRLTPGALDPRMIMPHCVCGTPQCARFCMPMGPKGWWQLADELTVDPVPDTRPPGGDPRQPGGEPGRPGDPDGDPLTRPPQ